MTWAARRQLTYFFIAFGVVLILIGVPAFLWLYEKPTCFDGKKNGGETGIDCGGSCTRLCRATEIRPVVEWQQAFEVVPGVYNAIAYVQNPNSNAEAYNVPYIFTFRDSVGKILGERKGKAYIPAGKNIAVFEGSITLPKGVPVRTSFDFLGDFDWLAAAADSPRVVVERQLVSDLSRAPIVTADLRNTSLVDLGRVAATAIVYDTEGNAVAASQTYLDRLDKQASGRIVFTWPKPFSGQVASCQQSVDVVLNIDRSGSMASDGKNPPEPLASVKQAALSFVDGLRPGDAAALVSFATEASQPIDTLLTDDRSLVKDSIRSIEILDNGTQYTNIYDALKASLDELSSNRHRSDAKRAIVLLTDGKPTYPEKKNDPTYPADRALAVARDAQSQGVDIYTIGLGKDIDEEFLKSVSGLAERYYRAPSSKDLTSVYTSIGSALCKLGPAKVEIIPDVPPRL